MVRTVRVRLELDRNDYKQGLRDAANDTRTFDGEVKALGKDAERTGVELKQTATEAGKLGDDVKKSSRDVDALGASVKKTGDESAKAKEKVTGLGTETDRTRGQMVNLAAEIDKTKAALKDLGAEFGRTGQVDVDRLRSLSTELSRLQKTRDDLLKSRDVKSTGILGGGFFGKLLGSTIKNSDIEAMVAQQAAEAGSLFGDGFLKGASRVLVAGGPVLLPAIAGLVAFAGAAIAGATLGATGLGAIAAGIALQFNSPAVHNAATELGSFVKRSLTEATEGFGPQFVQGVTALRREAEPLWADLRAGLQSLEPYVANILVRLGEGLAKLGPGLQRALEAAGPVLGALSKNIPTLLNAIGVFFDQISRGGVGATMAIDAIVKIVATLIVQLGVALRVASAFFEGMAIAGDKVTGVLAGIFNELAKIPGIGLAFKPVAEAFSTLHDYAHGVAVSFNEAGLSADGTAAGLSNVAGSANSASAAFVSLSQRFADVFGQFMGVDQATIALGQSMNSLRESVRTNGTALAGNSDKALANQSALLAVVQAAEQVRDKQIASGQSTAFANGQYEASIGALRAAAIAAGFNAQQVDALIGKYRQVPNSVTTTFLTPGLAEAIGNAHSLQAALNAVDGRVARASVVTTYYSNYVASQSPYGAPVARPGLNIARRWGGVTEHAATGTLRDATISSPMSPARYAYAEPQTGGEAFIPKYGNVGRSRSIWSYVGQNWLGMRPAIAGGGGTQTVVHEHHVTVAYPDGRKIGELLINDADHGGTAMTTFIRRVANR